MTRDDLITRLRAHGLTDAQLRLFAVRCARRVQHLMTDSRSLAVLDVAERHAKGEATDQELKAARKAARAAYAAVAWSAEEAMLSAAWAAEAATAAEAAEAAWTAYAAVAGLAAAASAAARPAEQIAQREILAQMKNETEDTP